MSGSSRGGSSFARGDRGRGGNYGDRGRGGGGGASGGRGRGRGGSGDRGGGDGGARGARGGRGGRGGRPAEAYSRPDGSVPPPVSTVTQLEDASAQSLKAAAAGTGGLSLEGLSLAEQHPRRPGYGNRGAAVMLWANYFHMNPTSGQRLFRYHVGISPEAAGRKAKRLVQLFITEGRISRLGAGIASDFRSTIVSCEQLGDTDLVEQVRYRFDEETEAQDNAQTYTVTLTHTGDFDVGDLIRYLASADARATYLHKDEVTQLLNIVLGHRPKSLPESSTLSIGSNRHYPLGGGTSTSFDLGAGLLAWRGYVTSVRSAASRILVNLQLKHVAVFEAIPLPALIDKFVQAYGRNAHRLEKFLKRLRVETTHLPGKRNKRGDVIRRIKTISGLASPNDGSEATQPPKVEKFAASVEMIQFYYQPAPNTTATPGLKPNTYYTVARYFRLAYSRDLMKDYPVVNVGTRKDPNYLPVDVCHVLQGQPARAMLSPNQTSRMIENAVREPSQNAKSIAEQGPSAIGMGSENATLTRFRISISPNMLTVPGRILSGPTVTYRNEAEARTQFGSWNMGGMKFRSGTDLGLWTVLVISDQPTNWGSITPTLQAFHAELTRIGVNASVPKMDLARWFSLRQQTIDGAFKFMSEQTPAPSLLFVILPEVDTALYNSIKIAADIKFGIHTVCVEMRKFATKGIQYYANVALKFNLKLGGHNQALEKGKLGIIEEGKTMVVGVDVTHPSPGSASTAPSVAGIVASINKSCGQFPATLRIQEARKEMVTELGGMFKTRLQLWQKHNKQSLPENIIIYRDGVSEGQYQIVVDEELPPIKEACRELYTASATTQGLPRISIIICGKRHNTRFYPTTSTAGKIDARSSNNPNGTVVDRGVTEPRNWDFFLQAHTAIQGTARPAHYYVVHDEIFAHRRITAEAKAQGFQTAADLLEDLTHNLSYMFGRATKAVSLCPPAYYADLVCERARCYLSAQFAPESDASTSASGQGQDTTAQDVRIHQKLRDTMFYI